MKKYCKLMLIIAVLICGCKKQTEAVFPDLNQIAWDDYSLIRNLLIEDELELHPDLYKASIYHLTLEIKDTLSDLSGTMKVLYTNKESQPIERILFVLFPNLVSGSLEIDNLTADGQEVILEYGPIKSFLIVRLPQPLVPGAKSEISMSYLLKVPDDTEKSITALSYTDKVFSLAFWYPTIPAHGDWECLPVPYGDFLYNEVSFYFVQVSFPSSLVLAAPGMELGRKEEAGRSTVTFVLGPARDLYLAASSRFVSKSIKAGDTIVRSYAFPEADAASESALTTAVHALKIFSSRFGSYPYCSFNLVSVPLPFFGLEFPGIILNMSRMYDPDWEYKGTPASILLEATTVHEVSHQWFYGLVGNDQQNEPWLDEALAQYSTLFYYRTRYGASAARGFYNSLIERWDRVGREEIPIGRPVGEYTRNEYGAIIYGRGPLFIEALSDRMGEEAFEAFLKGYVENYRWKTATGEDFLNLSEKYCACELDDLFAGWVCNNSQ